MADQVVAKAAACARVVLRLFGANRSVMDVARTHG